MTICIVKNWSNENIVFKALQLSEEKMENKFLVDHAHSPTNHLPTYKHIELGGGRWLLIG